MARIKINITNLDINWICQFLFYLFYLNCFSIFWKFKLSIITRLLDNLTLLIIKVENIEFEGNNSYIVLIKY